MGIKNRLKEYLEKNGVYPDGHGKYRCISGTHEDSRPSMSLHPSGEYLHCFACNESFDIYGAAAWRLGVPCDKAHFPRIAREVEAALGIPAAWQPSDGERRESLRKNRGAGGRQMPPLSKSAVFRDALLREMAGAIDAGNLGRAHEMAELVFALYLLPEEADGAGPAERREKERREIEKELKKIEALKKDTWPPC
jgi:hypothetical protein